MSGTSSSSTPGPPESAAHSGSNFREFSSLRWISFEEKSSIRKKLQAASINQAFMRWREPDGCSFLVHKMLEELNHPCNNKKGNKKISQDDINLRIRRKKTRNGLFIASIKVLSSNGIDPNDEATLNELLAKHPQDRDTSTSASLCFAKGQPDLHIMQQNSKLGEIHEHGTVSCAPVRYHLLLCLLFTTLSLGNSTAGEYMKQDEKMMAATANGFDIVQSKG
ncbi:hypothetical protein C5167_005065 [Papaver somniferum]|uniref:Uncharacterized protein n=1 Tax=Papaver somniferum TaxID=3469 RepID=A0A4Y7JDN7_PAPSO|nr:hypothetical protein C5167_005065 [Papaver somniferum]